MSPEVIHHLIHMVLDHWPERAGSMAEHYIERKTFQILAKKVSKELSFSGFSQRSPTPKISDLALYSPLTLGDCATIGLYLAGSMSFGSRAPAMLFVPSVYRHFLTVAQLEVLKARGDPGYEVDVMPNLLTFANGLLTALRMGAQLNPNLSIRLLEIATSIVNSAKKHVDSNTPLRMTSKKFSLEDLKRLYRDCLFSHGIALGTVRIYQVGFNESRCMLLDNKDFLSTSPDTSPLLKQWQITQRARGLAAMGDEKGFSESMVEASANIPSLAQFVKSQDDKWLQKSIQSLDPSRSVKAETEIVKACTCMIGGLYRSLELIANGNSRSGRKQLKLCVGPMMSLAKPSDDIWWHGYAHCALVDSVSTLAGAHGRSRKDNERKRAVDQIRSASTIFAATNDVGMAERSALIAREVLESGKLDISFTQANYLYFGRP